MANRLEGLRVLVVEDRGDTRELYALFLEQEGASVAVVHSAAAALEALASDRFDVLLSDVEMPVSDGYELIRRVRALPPDRGLIPAAAVTAYAQPEDQRRAREAGFQVHIRKPVEPERLVEVIAELAGRPAARA